MWLTLQSLALSALNGISGSLWPTGCCDFKSQTFFFWETTVSHFKITSLIQKPLSYCEHSASWLMEVNTTVNTLKAFIFLFLISQILIIGTLQFYKKKFEISLNLSNITSASGYTLVLIICARFWGVIIGFIFEHPLFLVNVVPLLPSWDASYSPQDAQMREPDPLESEANTSFENRGGPVSSGHANIGLSPVTHVPQSHFLANPDDRASVARVVEERASVTHLAEIGSESQDVFLEKKNQQVHSTPFRRWYVRNRDALYPPSRPLERADGSALALAHLSGEERHGGGAREVGGARGGVVGVIRRITGQTYDPIRDLSENKGSSSGDQARADLYRSETAEPEESLTGANRRNKREVWFLDTSTLLNTVRSAYVDRPLSDAIHLSKREGTRLEESHAVHSTPRRSPSATRGAYLANPFNSNLSALDPMYDGSDSPSTSIRNSRSRTPHETLRQTAHAGQRVRHSPYPPVSGNVAPTNVSEGGGRAGPSRANLRLSESQAGWSTSDSRADQLVSGALTRGGLTADRLPIQPVSRLSPYTLTHDSGHPAQPELLGRREKGVRGVLNQRKRADAL